jgi:hypothetical protein
LRSTALIGAEAGVNEAKWRTAEDPTPMLEFLVYRAADRKLRRAAVRKLRLCAGACARRVWHLLPSEHGRRWIEIAEALADGQHVPEDLERERANDGAFHYIDGYRRERANRICWHSLLAAQGAIQLEAEFLGHWTRPGGATKLIEVPENAARALAHVRRADDEAEMDYAVLADELAAMVPLVRDVFGDPFRPPQFDALWRTADTVGLARAIYENLAFHHLPILADALMDAGCDDEEIIEHCRIDCSHVRGCWVVDLVLNKGWPPNPVVHRTAAA